MGFLRVLNRIIEGGSILPPSTDLAIRENHPIQPTGVKPSKLEIPQLTSARGKERCYRCGQISVKDQLIYSYRGLIFGGDCIGRALILERESPDLTTEEWMDELITDMKRFKALGLARAAKRMMENL